jgi:5'-nucleotidase
VNSHDIEQLALARGIAAAAHIGVTDKIGVPYIQHPRRVAERLATPRAQAVAWLHDVIEDTPLKGPDLLAAGIDAIIVDAVQLLTRTDDVDPDAYYARIAASPLAKAVKLADIADNTDPLRARLLPDEKRRQLAEKYAHALEVLGTAAPKPILYVDLDNTLVDFPSGIRRLSAQDTERYDGHYDDAPGIFSLMEPVEGAVEAFRRLSRVYDAYILSTAPWDNPSAWQHKLEWVQLHFGTEEGSPAYKRLILSHHKNLNRGAYLVDDRGARGASEFEGEWLRFGSDEFPDWRTTTAYLLDAATTTAQGA